MACEQDCPSEIDQRVNQIIEQIEFASQPEGAAWSFRLLSSSNTIDSLVQKISNERNTPINSDPISRIKYMADSLLEGHEESQELWWYDYSDKSYIEHGFVVTENCKVQERLHIGSN